MEWSRLASSDFGEGIVAKLRFINEHRPGSMQQWVRGVVEEAIENGIREILQEQR
jgi:hypothetical protein